MWARSVREGVLPGTEELKSTLERRLRYMAVDKEIRQTVKYRNLQDLRVAIHLHHPACQETVAWDELFADDSIQVLICTTTLVCRTCVRRRLCHHGPLGDCGVECLGTGRRVA